MGNLIYILFLVVFVSGLIVIAEFKIGYKWIKGKTCRYYGHRFKKPSLNKYRLEVKRCLCEDCGKMINFKNGKSSGKKDKWI